MENEEDKIKEIIAAALQEDIGRGDITSLATIPLDKTYEGIFRAKERCVVAGLEAAGKVFKTLDNSIIFEPIAKEGDWVGQGDALAVIRGNGQKILTGERTALNILQRMSGIATMTRRFVDAVSKTKAVILDTRKTVPGLRIIDKMAVRMGGGQNHRFGLHDMFLIKDNHIVAAGSITKAFENAQAANRDNLLIEIEVGNMEELKEALDLRPSRIMLDNMDVELMRWAVELAGGRVPLEASGNINIDNVAAVAATGVDYISIGALTHSVKAADINLKIDN